MSALKYPQGQSSLALVGYDRLHIHMALGVSDSGVSSERGGAASRHFHDFEAHGYST